MYTNDCGYCDKFNPIYNKVQGIYNGRKCKFLKIDAMTEYGTAIMRDLQVTYVPFVALINKNSAQFKTIVPTCLLDFACTKNAIEKFIN